MTRHAEATDTAYMECASVANVTDHYRTISMATETVSELSQAAFSLQRANVIVEALQPL